jgi:hypothetical protein
MRKKQNNLQSKSQILLDCATLFEAAGSVVTVKRSPSSKRGKARGDAKGADILSSGQSKPPLERDSV